MQVRGQVGVCMQKSKCSSLLSSSLQATESTEDIPSEGHYYLQRQTVDHTREGNASTPRLTHWIGKRVRFKAACFGEKQQPTVQDLHKEIYCSKAL